MKDNSELIVYAIGGVFVVVLLYSIRDYIVIGLVSAGAIYIYRLANESNDKNKRR